MVFRRARDATTTLRPWRGGLLALLVGCATSVDAQGSLCNACDCSNVGSVGSTSGTFLVTARRIGPSAFNPCRGLNGATTLRVMPSVQTLEQSAFVGLLITTLIVEPGGPTVIPVNLCSSCSRLANIWLPDGIRIEATPFFHGVPASGQIRIGAGANIVSSFAFSCSSLQSSGVRTSETCLSGCSPTPCNQITIGTSAPPSTAPSRSPTRSPTPLPTRTPTAAPVTQNPTTGVPTFTPTTVPSHTPTTAPTNAPTTAPSEAPSNTVITTMAPLSLAPLVMVTAVPSAQPTSHPHAVPSSTPTPSPQAVPLTATPSLAPTSASPSVLSRTPITATPTDRPTVGTGLLPTDDNGESDESGMPIALIAIIISIACLAVIVALIVVRTRRDRSAAVPLGRKTRQPIAMNQAYVGAGFTTTTGATGGTASTAEHMYETVHPNAGPQSYLTPVAGPADEHHYHAVGPPDASMLGAEYMVPQADTAVGENMYHAVASDVPPPSSDTPYHFASGSGETLTYDVASASDRVRTGEDHYAHARSSRE